MRVKRGKSLQNRMCHTMRYDINYAECNIIISQPQANKFETNRRQQNQSTTTVDSR